MVRGHVHIPQISLLGLKRIELCYGSQWRDDYVEFSLAFDEHGSLRDSDHCNGSEEICTRELHERMSIGR